MSKKWLILFVPIVLFYALFHLFFFGAHLAPCAYTVKEIPSDVPVNTIVTLKKDAVLLKNHQHICAPIVNKVPDEIYAEYVGKDTPQWEKQQFMIPKGTKFTIVHALEITAHGFHPDSDFKPRKIYILKDEQGSLYQIDSFYAYFNVFE